jgi:ATP-dependent DNA helicase DinG
MNLSEILAPALPGFHLEDRPQQNRMAEAVAATLRDGGVLLAEAGTGVGKSFAYLLPALEYALRTGTPVVVSTHTLTLQEQLFTKDLPVVQRALEAMGLGPARVALLKGRGQYLSRRRLKLAREGLLQTDFGGDSECFERLEERASRDAEGTFASLGSAVPFDKWSEVRSDAFHCLGARCETYDSCFYQNARRRAYDAHLILVNHALLLSDLALKLEQETGVLPPYKAVIIDEAHHLPALAADHLSTSVSQYEVTGLARRLLHGTESGGKAARGLLAVAPVEGAGEAVEGLLSEADKYFMALGEGFKESAFTPRPVPLPKVLPDVSGFENALGGLERLLRRAESAAPSDEVRQELEGCREEILDLLRRLSFILERGWDEEACYIVEPDEAAIRRGRLKAGALKAVPFEPSGLLRECLLSNVQSAVLTSATLSVAGDFGYFRRALGAEGLPKVTEVLFGSPFDFRRQVTLFLPKKMPHPRREEEAWMKASIEYIRASIKRSHGKAFVLFTSFKALRRTAEALRPDLEKLGITMLIQGEEGWDRTRLLNVFREDVDSVLFGVNSFWEGVDVPGEALSNLILTKLPFQVPEGPVVEARHKRLREMGLTPFSDESLPEAVLRLKQGFGRLIRNATDKGTVTILDPRVLTESWGGAFLTALPDCERVLMDGPDGQAFPMGAPQARKSRRAHPSKD